jgi:hypothetical protein
MPLTNNTALIEKGYIVLTTIQAAAAALKTD